MRVRDVPIGLFKFPQARTELFKPPDKSDALAAIADPPLRERLVERLVFLFLREPLRPRLDLVAAGAAPDTSFLTLFQVLEAAFKTSLR